MILSRLKEHRERRGLTQIELAKIAGVGRATIAALETGKRTRVHEGTRAKLARALKVKPHELGKRSAKMARIGKPKRRIRVEPLPEGEPRGPGREPEPKPEKGEPREPAAPRRREKTPT